MIEEKCLPIPPKTLEYIKIRRQALSDSSCRAQDTMSKHMSWIQYHQQMQDECPAVDMIAWEMAYKEISDATGYTIAYIQRLRYGYTTAFVP